MKYIFFLFYYENTKEDSFDNLRGQIPLPLEPLTDAPDHAYDKSSQKHTQLKDTFNQRKFL